MSISPPPAAARAAAPSIEQEELRGISRTVAEIHWLLLILVLLFVIFGTPDKLSETAVTAALFFYGAFVMAFRYANLYKRETRWKVALETWAMIGFITWVCYYTGGLASPLLNTFLLPVITSSLTLGKLTTLVEVALIAACQVFLGGSFSMDQLLSLAFLGGFAAQIAPVILVAYIVSMFSADIRYGLSRAKLLSETDELTGLLNMRGFSIAANRLFGQAVRYNRAATVLMIDSDNLKAVNDTHGHEAGNRLLKQLTRLVQAELRYTDVLARYGGDEFVVLLPETPPAGAFEVASRIREAIASMPLEVDSKRVTCTVSIGLASHPADGNSMDAVVARADRAMYEAKRAGRNRVVQFRAEASGGEGDTAVGATPAHPAAAEKS
jgi:diguanylate cyclase (GGDEF)-like protein